MTASVTGPTRGIGLVIALAQEHRAEKWEPASRKNDGTTTN